MKSLVAKVALLTLALSTPIQFAVAFSPIKATPATTINCPEAQSEYVYTLVSDTATPAFFVHLKTWNSSKCTLLIVVSSKIKCFVPILDMKDSYRTKDYSAINNSLKLLPKTSSLISVTSMFPKEAEDCRNYVPEETGNYGMPFLAYGFTRDMGTHYLRVASVTYPPGTKSPIAKPSPTPSKKAVEVKLKPCDQATVILGRSYKSQILTLSRIRDSYKLEYEVAMVAVRNARAVGNQTSESIALLDAQSAQRSAESAGKQMDAIGSKITALLKKCTM